MDVWTEANNVALPIYRQPRSIWIIRIVNIPARITKHFLISFRFFNTFMSKINPIIKAKNGPVYEILRISECKSREHYFFDIRFTVSIGILEIVHIWRIGYEDSFFPTHYAGR